MLNFAFNIILNSLNAEYHLTTCLGSSSLTRFFGHDVVTVVDNIGITLFL